MLPIYCISLQRERKNRFLKAKKKYFDPLKLDVIEWKAIDGSKFKNSRKLAEKCNFSLSKRLGTELNKSVVATAASHRSVWQEIIKKNLDAAIILEDDVTIKKRFKIKSMEIWKLIKKDVNIKYLLLSYSDNILVDSKEHFYNNLINKVFNFNGLFCYLVKKEGAKELIELTNTLIYQVDIHISKKNLTFYCTKDKLGYYNDEIITTIHLHRFKLLEVYGKLTFIRYKIVNVIDFYNLTIFSIIMILLGVYFSLNYYSWIKVNLISFIILILDLKIVGGRFDELNIRIPGIIKDIGSYDSDEIANKLVDHVFLLLAMIITNLCIYLL